MEYSPFCELKRKRQMTKGDDVRERITDRTKFLKEIRNYCLLSVRGHLSTNHQNRV